MHDGGKSVLDVHIPCRVRKVCLKLSPVGSRLFRFYGRLSGQEVESAERGYLFQAVNGVRWLAGLKLGVVFVMPQATERNT